MESIKKNYRRTITACYFGFITQSITANYLPLLYITFSRSFGVSFSQLAMISTILFVTQILMDYLCARVVDRIGYRICIVASEVLSFLGLAGLSFLPDLLPSAYAGILICVFIYAVGSGVIEVLCNPIMEACPFENKDKVMSLMHSFYCWGTVGVILGSTLFFALFGTENWRILAVIWSLVPLYNVFGFSTCPIEPLLEEGKGMSIGKLIRTKFFWIVMVLMVCAGASEIGMAQWASAFVESALHVSKTIGDLAGPCGFAVFMGLSRVIYGKFGDRMDLSKYMIGSGILCLLCYLVSALAAAPVLGLVGCTLCGFSVGIMWPGSISISSGLFPDGGTALFALLALSGDIGAAVGPAIVGAVSQRFGNDLKSGILAGTVFPILLVFCVILLKYRKKGS